MFSLQQSLHLTSTRTSYHDWGPCHHLSRTSETQFRIETSCSASRSLGTTWFQILGSSANAQRGLPFTKERGARWIFWKEPLGVPRSCIEAQYPKACNNIITSSIIICKASDILREFQVNSTKSCNIHKNTQNTWTANFNRKRNQPFLLWICLWKLSEIWRFFCHLPEALYVIFAPIRCKS